MAASKPLETHQIKCEPCLYNTISVAAEFWCLSCEDGLCQGCTNSHKGIRATRDHKVITVEKYHEINGDDALVSQECKEHGKMLELYCNDHETALCVLCLPKSHRECKIISLDEASKNVTSSTNFTRVVKNTDNLTEFLTEQVEHLRDNLDRLGEERSTIGLKIDDVIKRLHSQVDKSGQKLREKLASSYNSCRDTISCDIQKLESKQEEMRTTKRKFGHLKEVASNKQLFLAVSESGTKIQQDLDQVQNEFADMKISRSLELQLSSVLDEVLKLDALGFITISETKLSCISKLQMAEAQLPSQEARVSVEVDRVTLSKELEVMSPEPGERSITPAGCLLLPNSDMMFSDPNNCSIKVYNTGNNTTVVMKTPFQPQDLAVLSTENNTIAVTYGNSNRFGIAYFTNYQFKTIRNIKTISACWGISSNKELIAVKCTYTGIHLYNLKGDCLRSFEAIDSLNCFFTFITDQKMYFSKADKDTVSCFDLHGKELWNKQKIAYPIGLTGGSSGEVFVASRSGIVVISEDGSRVKCIDTGLTDMKTVSFCKSSRRLLVRSQNKSVLFKVLYN